MKAFLTLNWNERECRRELEDFRVLLSSSLALGEREQILPFFRSHPHLAAYLGTYHPDLIFNDSLSFEYDLFGDYTCDLVVADARHLKFVFVEFEDAAPNGIFQKKSAKATSEWTTRFAHGFHQIVDWFCKLEDMERTNAFADRFGANSIDYRGLLVIGRSAGLSDSERRRLRWHCEKVMVNSRNILCVTFDELCENLTVRLDRFSRLERKPAVKKRRK